MPGRWPRRCARREEEIGLSRRARDVRSAICTDTWCITGFCVTPVVGFVPPGFELAARSRPKSTTTSRCRSRSRARPANHQRATRTLGTASVHVYDIPYGEHHIWGATAGMLVVAVPSC